jgi:hypothetical protein
MAFQPNCLLKTLYPFQGENEDELTLDANMLVTFLEQKGDWIVVEATVNGEKREGLIPLSYVEIVAEQKQSPKKQPPVIPPKTFKQPSIRQTSPIQNSSGVAVSKTDGVDNTALKAPFGAEKQFRLPPLNNNGASSSTEKVTNGSSTGSTRNFATPAVAEENPFETLSNPVPQPLVEEDDRIAEEVAGRLQALKARINDLEANHVLVAEVVHPPPLSEKPLISQSSQSQQYPTLGRPASIIAMEDQARRQQEEELRRREEAKKRELEELREQQRLQLAAESQARAQQKQREAEEAERRRVQEQQEEFERIRRNSAVLSASTKTQANFLVLAQEKNKQAVVNENNRRMDEARKSYIEVLGYLQKAFENNQIAEKAAALADMEGIVEKLSEPPYSERIGSFDRKVDFLACMCKYGYDVLQKAAMLRDLGRGFEQQRDISRAIRYYRQSLEWFLAYDKAYKLASKTPEPTITKAMLELLDHAEQLDKWLKATGGQ